MSPPQFFTIHQIDAIKGIRTPHDRDLLDIGKKHVDLFKVLKKGEIDALCEAIGAIVEDLDYGESWTITKEYFPDVKIHALLQFDDEGLSADPYEIQFLFSGNRVTWLSGEDLCHLVEIFLNYAATVITGQFPQDIYTGNPSPLLSKAMKERTISWSEVEIDEELRSYYKFTPFPGLMLKYDITQKPIVYSIQTKKINEFWIYDIDRLIIMGLNQILRIVKIQLDMLNKSVPAICNAMFSGNYKKTHADKFP